MSGGVRTVALVIGGLLLAGGVALTIASHGASFMAVLPGLLIVGSVLFEGRYRRSTTSTAPAGAGWQQTSETFRDDETGRMVTVWFHPATGERRYVAQGE